MADDDTALRAKVERMQRDARLLHELASGLNATLGLDDLYALVLNTMGEVFGFEHCMVLLVDERDDLLRVAASRGYDDPGIGAVNKIGAGVIGMAAKKKAIKRFTGLMQRRRYGSIVRESTAAAGQSVGAISAVPGLPDAESQMAIPMLIGDRLIGVVAMESREHDVFTEDDEILVATVANHFAAAIEIARFVSTLEERVAQRTAELRDTQAQLVHAGKMASLGSLVAGIAHEINTPIASVVSSNATLAATLDKLAIDDAPAQQRLLEVARSSIATIADGAGRVGAIISRLRSFARLDEAALQRADIHQALGDTIALAQRELGERTLVTDQGELPELVCNARQLNQVFLNILLNAIEATAEDGRIAVRTRAVSGAIEVAFEDDGRGMDDEVRAKIFDPGFTTKGVRVGTGLGLSIAYRIVEEHGGEIRVESAPGEGSTFTVVLPLGRDGRQPAP